MSYDPSMVEISLGSNDLKGYDIEPRILTLEFKTKVGSLTYDTVKRVVNTPPQVVKFRNVPAYVVMDSMRRTIKNLTGVGVITAVRDDGTVLIDVSYDELEYY